MLIHDILGLKETESIYFAEDSYASLKNNFLSIQYLENIQNDPDADISEIKDEKGDIVGLVLYNPESEESPSFRAVFTNIVSSSPIPNNSNMQFLDIAKHLKLKKSYNVKTRELIAAILEYYSLSLINRELCENCISEKEPYNMVYIESRNARLRGILEKYPLKGEILEICCGNGMSTLPMHKMGYDPLTIDNDRCQICQGLEHDVLKKERTIILDATKLTQFFKKDSFDTIVGFMLGTIYQFNKNIWEQMMFEAAHVLKTGGKLLLTVNKKEEMEILNIALGNCNIKGEIIDNRDDKGIYDQWIFIGTK